jgi:hypothetical protein
MNYLLKNWRAFSRIPHTAVWGSFKYGLHAVHEPSLREYPQRELGDRSSTPYAQYTSRRSGNTPNGSWGIVQTLPTKRAQRTSPLSPRAGRGVGGVERIVALRTNLRCRPDLKDPHTAVWGLEFGHFNVKYQHTEPGF